MRLMAISTKPSASSPRLGFIKAQTSGRFFHAFLRFPLLAGDGDAIAVAMILDEVYSPGLDAGDVCTTILRNVAEGADIFSRPRFRTGHAGRGGPVEVQDAGDELADGDPQMAPKPALQTGVILRSTEEIAHQLPEYRAAPHELNHARGNRAAQKRSAVEPPHDACCELQFGTEGSLYPSRVFFRAAFGKRAPQQFAGANGVKKSFARQGIHPRRRISDERPILSNHRSFGKRALFRRWQHMAVKLCAFGLYAVLFHEGLQMAAQFRAGVRGHAPANPNREMIAARERPDITLKVRQKLDSDGVAGLRHEVTLRHFQLVPLQRPCFRNQLIACAGRKNQKISFLPFALNAVARLRRSSVHAHYARTLHLAARISRAIQQHAVEHRPRIDYDRVGHFERCVLLLAADQLDGIYQFFGIGIIKQEREALNGFVGQSAATGFFPSQVLIKKINLVARAPELLTAHCAGRSAADDCYMGHGRVSLRAFSRVRARGTSVMRSLGDWSYRDGALGEGKDHQAKARLEYSTE